MLVQRISVTTLVLWTALGSAGGGRGLDAKTLDGRQAQTIRPESELLSREEFERAVGDLRAAAPESPASRDAMEQALRILDIVAITSLRGADQDVVTAANQRLAGYVTRQPAAGEGYRVIRIRQGPDAYVLAANFGSSGPSAARVYAKLGPQKGFTLAGRIDRFSQKDYFDDYLQLFAVDPSAAVFVTVTGRTDELRSGWFAAWQFDGKGVVEVWSSELLSHSNYETVPRGIVITYCADSDEQNPVVCRRMLRERHLWDGTAWKRVQQEEIPATGR